MSDLGAENDFSRFVADRYASLVHYGVTLVGDAARAEDLVQSALIKTGLAWSRVDSGRADSYTRKVMARAAWKLARRRWNDEIPTAVVPEPAAPGSDAFLMVDSADAVRRLLVALPIQQRVVLTLRYLDEFSEAEIARVLGCPAGTVKSRAARGLDELRRLGLLSDRRSSTNSHAEGTGA